MTGRELIIYILENHLEDEDIFKDGKIVGLRTLSEVAERYEVGVETVRTWIAINKLDAVNITNGLYVPITSTPKIESPLLDKGRK